MAKELVNKVIFSEEEKRVFYLQSELLKRAPDLLDSRIKSIEDKAKGLDDRSIGAAEKEAKILIAIFQVRSIKFYKKVLNFLAQEVLKENEEDDFFLLPHSRTILDIYSRFLHLLENCRTENDKALICLALQCRVYRVVNNVEDYTKLIGFNRNFLKSINFDFPEDPSDLSNNWIKRHNLGFYNASDLLTEDLVKKYSVQALKIFPAKKTYFIYSQISEMVHGNPYYLTERPHNERFWVISNVIINVSYLIELIDRYFLDKINPRDYRVWLSDVDKSRNEFTSLWQKRRKNLKDLS